MPIMNLTGVRVVEGNSSFQSADFTVTIDQPQPNPTNFFYFVQDVTASDAAGDINQALTSGSIPAGSTQATIRVPVFGDSLVEGDETFQVVLYAAPGVDLRDGAAYLVATGTIADNDDGIADSPAAAGEPAIAMFGPETVSQSQPTLTVLDAVTA